MEGIILLGLAGAGYLINKDSKAECYILEVKNDEIIEHKSNSFDTFTLF